MARSGVTRVVPGLVATSLAMAGLASGVPPIAAVAVLVLLLMTPWARPLALRVMVSLVLVLALGGVLSRAWILPWNGALMVGVVLALACAHVLVSLRLRADVPLSPEVSGPDALAMLGGAALVVVLGLPYFSASPDDALLDLARGFDPVNHVLMTANLISEGGPAWTSAGGQGLGSPPAFRDYPLGLHTVLAGALHLAGVAGSRQIVLGYGWSIVLGLGIAGAVLGWISIRVAREVAWRREARATELLAASATAGGLLLGGSLVGPFELGHGPFVITAATGVAASWLVLSRPSPGSPRWSRLAILVAGGIALLGAYPPLAVGLVPAGTYVLLRCVPFGRRTSTVLIGLSLLVGGGVILWLWRGQISHLINATGEHSTPLVLSVVLVVLTAAGVWLTREASSRKSPARALAVSLGYLAGALAIALGAARAGSVPGASYYAAKLGEAAWLAALPVLVALASYGTVELTHRLRQPARVATRGLLMGCFVGAIALLPVGRAQGGMVGPATLAQRWLETERARGLVQVTRAAQLAGPSGGDASGMVEPAGWFYKVSREDAPDGQWERAAVSASLWMATLRGVRTEATDAVAHCFTDRGDSTAIPCVDAWLEAAPTRNITIAVRDSPSAADFVEWAGNHPDHVRIVRLDR